MLYLQSRLAMVSLQVLAPHLLTLSLERFEHQLRNSGSLNISPRARESILAVLPFIRKSITVIHRLHLAAFYINGSFYHIAKRFAGIHYVSLFEGTHCFVYYVISSGWILDQSLMISWRKNSWNSERVSSVFTFVSVCMSVRWLQITPIELGT